MDGFDYDTIINIIGKFGCKETSLCTLIENDVKEKINANIKFKIRIFFETQLEAERNELIKEDPNFLEFKESPVVYLTVKIIDLISKSLFIKILKNSKFI